MPAAHQDNLHQPAVLGVAEAAEYLGVSRRTIHRWRAAGLLPYLRLPSGRYAYSRVKLEKAIRAWDATRW